MQWLICFLMQMNTLARMARNVFFTPLLIGSTLKEKKNSEGLGVQKNKQEVTKHVSS